MATFENEIAVLVAAYKEAIKRIRAELLSLDIMEMSRAHTEAALREVARILASLNEESAAWVAKYVPEAGTAGVVDTLVALGVAESRKAAADIAKFNRMNSRYVNAVIADTQADLLAVTQNVDRRVRAAIRQVTAESMRANMAAGINGRRTINRDTLAGMRKALGDAVDTGIIDAAGRRWKPETYVDMVTRTKLAETERQTAMNEAVQRSALYGIISSHGATDACRNYERLIVKLVPDAPGDYRYIGDLPRREIFHPNCRHQVTALRDPDRVLGESRTEPGNAPIEK
ncbi:phage minor capsid protein [Paenibacillus sp. PAMC21692]|uniref:phage minor capsid protein n=1 Tax=Paenibacillus sp. PAMC21692 TaxID=2762320 RepID=UPI00164E055B|nr:phage minor capsid protein [Paenibacillus sp. PAMC21692]QNK54557.1 minor capsid protein [Paenibacillus sp. PAMC21692]